MADKAIDGDTNGSWGNGSLIFTNHDGESDPWWRVRLKAYAEISHIYVYRRIANNDSIGSTRILNFVLTVYKNGAEMFSSANSDETVTLKRVYQFIMPAGIVGDEVEIMLPGENRILNLAEVQVFGKSVSLC